MPAPIPSHLTFPPSTRGSRSRGSPAPTGGRSAPDRMAQLRPAAGRRLLEPHAFTRSTRYTAHVITLRHQGGFVPDDSGPDWSRVDQQLPDDYFRQPSPARVWNYWLGGKDNYEPDQTVGTVVADIYPGIRTMATQSRQFLIRSVRYLTEEVGIRQFLDLGAGLPDPLGNNTHSIAQMVVPDAKIVY